MQTISSTSSINQSALKAINSNTESSSLQQELVEDVQRAFCVHHHRLESTYDALTAAALAIAGFPYQYHVNTGKTSQGLDTYVSFKVYSPCKVVYVYLTEKRLLSHIEDYKDCNDAEKMAVITHAQAAFQQDITSIPFNPFILICHLSTFINI